MANDIKQLNEAYSNMRQTTNFAELYQIADELEKVYFKGETDDPNFDDYKFEKMENKFWRKIRDAVKVFLAANNQTKRISAYAAEMSDSDVNGPHEIIDLLKNPRAMMANYREFLDASVF